MYCNRCGGSDHYAAQCEVSSVASNREAPPVVEAREEGSAVGSDTDRGSVVSSGETVSLPRSEYQALKADAEHWRKRKAYQKRYMKEKRDAEKEG